MNILRRNVVCHADGDRCHGCDHYHGNADVCEFASTPSKEEKEGDVLKRLRGEIEAIEAHGKQPDGYIRVWRDNLLEELTDSVALITSQASRITELEEEIEKEEIAFIQIINERDSYHDMADKLANAIELHFGSAIGEHSNMNCPWENALELFPQREPS